MAADPSIYGAIRQPELANPLADMAAFEQLRGAQQQNQLAQLAFGDRQRAIADGDRMRGIYGQGLQGEALENSLLQGGFQPQALALAEQRRKTGESTSQNAERGVKTAGGAFDNFKAILGTVQDPAQAEQFVIASYNDPTVGPILQKMGPLEQGIQKLREQASTPQGFQQWKANAAIGIEKLAQMAKVSTNNLGGSMQTTLTQPATGQVTQLASAPITQDANSIASNARMAADAAAGRSVSIRGQNMADARSMRGQNMTDARARDSQSAAMSRPFEVTGADGNPVLVQQDKAGNIRPVEGFTPKGGTSKPLPAGVVKQITETRDNAATIDRLTKGFKPDFAGKGVGGFGADLQLEASGRAGVDKDAVEWWKNYRKESELVERHALFGAALTPSEQASWRSADIAPGMNDKVVARNLATRAALSKKVAQNAQQDLVDAGHSEKRIGAIAGRNTAVEVGGAPAVGAVQGGYRFKGGNPADKANWERQ